MFNSSSFSKTMRASMTGFFHDSIHERNEALEKVPHKGDRLCSAVFWLPVKKTSITCLEKSLSNSFTHITQEGMENLMEKPQYPPNCTMSALKTNVIAHFHLTKSYYKAGHFKVGISFWGKPVTKSFFCQIKCFA